jgi:polygalacturonase
MIMKRLYWASSLAALTLASGCVTNSNPKPVAGPALPVIPSRTVSVADFGGKSDGVTLNTEAFAKAIAALDKQGGGQLTVLPGIWLTGPIRLCSHLNLHLEPGALIQFSGDPALYPLMAIDIKGEKEVDSVSPIFGENLEDVAITGHGIIDGGGDAWRPIKREKLTEGEWKALVRKGHGVLNDKTNTWYPSRQIMEGEKPVKKLRDDGNLNVADYEPYHQYLRPKMLRIINCKRLLLQDVIVQNPPNWTINPVLCEDVSILNVTVRNAATAQNSDALDLESCRHAVIRGCVFDVGDDGICLKSGKDEVGRRIGVPTEDVLVEDCVVYHAHGGFTIGSEMSGGVRNVRVRNCTFMGTDIGLRFKSARGRGGVVEDIDIANVRMSDIAGDAINFSLFYEGKSPKDENGMPQETNLPPVSEKTPVFKNIRMENILCRGAQKAIVMAGLAEMPLAGIVFKNCYLTAERGAFLANSTNIILENVDIENKTGAAVNLSRVKDIKLDHLSCAPGTEALVQAGGPDVKKIILIPANASAAKTNLILTNGAIRDEFDVK